MEPVALLERSGDRGRWVRVDSVGPAPAGPPTTRTWTFPPETVPR